MMRSPVLYPRIYPWFVLVATLDVLLTWQIIAGMGGSELNPLAASLISSHGMQAAAFYKFATVAFVLIACEVVGRRRVPVGRRLACTAVAINCVPVTMAVAQIAAY